MMTLEVSFRITIFLYTGHRRSKTIPENSLLNAANERSAKIQISGK
jgi:hypothetical protein